MTTLELYACRSCGTAVPILVLEDPPQRAFPNRCTTCPALGTFDHVGTFDLDVTEADDPRPPAGSEPVVSVFGPGVVPTPTAPDDGTRYRTPDGRTWEFSGGQWHQLAADSAAQQDMDPAEPAPEEPDSEPTPEG